MAQRTACSRALLITGAAVCTAKWQAGCWRAVAWSASKGRTSPDVALAWSFCRAAFCRAAAKTCHGASWGPAGMGRPRADWELWAMMQRAALSAAALAPASSSAASTCSVALKCSSRTRMLPGR